MNILDTIAAVSTPRGKGGVAMIRISGGEALDVADRVFTPACGKPVSGLETRLAAYGSIFEQWTCGERRKIDDGVVTVYRAPRSFTGEDTVEICCHGGILVTESVLSACLAAGCRAAEPGEFTRRAFVSGKMTLSEAEDLGALLEAKTQSQVILSRSGLDGRLSGELSEVYGILREILSSVYAKIDFPDEDLASIDEEEMLLRVDGARERLRALEETARTGIAVREGVRTVICGRTNAGKSSLYNRILGRAAAIVTDIEGTTRDILEQTAELGGMTLLLCDTAGLRATEDKVEAIGIERSRRAVEEAELVIAVFDISSPKGLSFEDIELLRELKGRPDTLAVLNKCDEVNALTADKLEEEIKGYVETTVRLSAKTGEGFERLGAAVKELFGADKVDLSRDAVITNARQKAAVERAYSLLSSASDGLSSGLSVDICGSDIEEAMSALLEIDGREVSEDIVSDIFSHFCVGK